MVVHSCSETTERTGSMLIHGLYARLICQSESSTHTRQTKHDPGASQTSQSAAVGRPVSQTEQSLLARPIVCMMHQTPVQSPTTSAAPTTAATAQS